jgi:ABC-2 type transport system ATP-binding protein
MIEIKNINFSYGKHMVFDNVTMTLEPGMIYGLLGQNGVGKSTLLKLISGLLKLKNGSCTVNGYLPFKREPSFLSNIYFLPEDFSGPDTIIKTYAKNMGIFYPHFSMDKFESMAKELDVETSAKFTKLSFGQQKKAIISFALATGTEILLMDEPSNGLDIPSKVILRRLIAQNAGEDQIIVISTHQVRDLENLIDPIIILDRGGVLMNESIATISGKLHFGIEPQKNNSALYSEQTLNGYLTVTENKSGLETNVDLEGLFNCTLANKERIKQLFTSNK